MEERIVIFLVRSRFPPDACIYHGIREIVDIIWGVCGVVAKMWIR